ncbi:uncharacterized protein TA20140 [Theileria annulata]|uniref:Translation initiation factor eIF2B subunit gamma n=1 Tax=Theileria annulata TaxID=5874 RepID=Q4UHC9_THEAN|nr:uncharacterized protein TA20140 [Theileria annulata]CAI73510.1 hypothetical protein, conserved [Theileria annulata]|eukprot:XP_954187.1 hypothetical protein, conserved [Theileria annulata]
MGDESMNGYSLPYDITAVVLSGGSSNNFVSLTRSLPKILIKVGSNTLLYHTVRNLTINQFKEVIILTSDNDSSLVDENVELSLNLLRDEFGSERLPKVSVVGLPCSDDSSIGSADSLNYISDLIKNDFLVLPCDLFGNFDFKSFLMEHIKSPRLCTVALLDINSMGSPKGKKEVCLGGNDFEEWSYKYRVATVMDKSTCSLLAIAPVLSVESGENLQLFRHHLINHHNSLITHDLVDIHVYAFSTNIFKILRCDFLHNSSIRRYNTYIIVKYIVDYLKNYNLQSVGNELENINNKSWKLSDVVADEFLEYTRTFYFIASGESFNCMRVNSIDSLYSANIKCSLNSKEKIAKKTPKIKNVLLGRSTEVSESAEIKNSVIGCNVRVGDKAKITDSVVMDNCTIESNTVVNKSILGTSVILKENSNVKNSIIKSETTVPENTMADKEYIPSFIYS